MPRGVRDEAVSAAHIEVARQSSRRRSVAVIAFEETIHADICHREIVGGVIWHFPDELRADRVDDDLSAEVNTHPLRAVFDLHVIHGITSFVADRWLSSGRGQAQSCHLHRQPPRLGNNRRRAPRRRRRGQERVLGIGPSPTKYCALLAIYFCQLFGGADGYRQSLIVTHAGFWRRLPLSFDYSMDFAHVASLS